MQGIRLRLLAWLVLGKYLPLYDVETLSIKDGVACGNVTALGQTVARWLRLREEPQCCERSGQ